MTAATTRSETGTGQGQLTVGDVAPTTFDAAGVPLIAAKVSVGALGTVLDAYAGREVDGLIGGVFFHQHVAELDFARQTLKLDEPGAYIYSGKGIRLPFVFSNGVPVAQGAIELPDGEKLPVRLLIDLGAKANLLVSQAFVDAHHLQSRFASSVEEPLGAGLGGETRYMFVRLRRLQVGENPGLAFVRPIIGLSARNSVHGGYYDALLGVGFLQRFKLTIDYAHQQMIFEPRLRPPRDRFDRSGLFLTASPADLHQILVHEVVVGSPGAAAGLQVGDVLDDLNGTPARSLSLTRIRATLSSRSTGPIRIVVTREGKQIELTMRLRDLI